MLLHYAYILIICFLMQRSILSASEFKGIGFAILSYICMACLNVIMSYLGHTIPALMLTTIKAMLCLMIFLPIALLKFDFPYLIRNIQIVNIVKGLLDCISVPIWIYAITKMKMADAIALSYMTPIFLVILARFNMKDSLRLDQAIVMLCCLLGVYIILNPNFAGMDYNGLLVLFVSFLWATSGLITKRLATGSKQHPLAIVVYTNFVLFTVSAPFAFSVYDFPKLESDKIIYLVLFAAFSGSAFLGTAYAYKNAKISLLAPFDYLRLVFTSIAAYLFLSQNVTMQTVIGASIIFLGSFYLTGKQYIACATAKKAS